MYCLLGALVSFFDLRSREKGGLSVSGKKTLTHLKVEPRTCDFYSFMDLGNSWVKVVPSPLFLSRPQTSTRVMSGWYQCNVKLHYYSLGSFRCGRYEGLTGSEVRRPLWPPDTRGSSAYLQEIDVFWISTLDLYSFVSRLGPHPPPKKTEVQLCRDSANGDSAL